MAQAAAFAWLGGIQGRLQFERSLSIRVVCGLPLIGFALVGYPAIEWLGDKRHTAT